MPQPKCQTSWSWMVLWRPTRPSRANSLKRCPFHQGERKWKSLSHVQLLSHGLYSPWNSPGQNTGVGSLFLLQGIFPTQGLNPGVPHCRWTLYQLSHKGSTRTLEWVACPFSSGSSWSRNQTGVSFTGSGFFTNWAIWKTPHHRRQECKSRKLRDIWSNRQVWPWSTKWSRAKANRVLPSEPTGHTKHSLSTTQEKTLPITRCSILKSNWL